MVEKIIYGYIIYDRKTKVIFGVGKTEHDAWMNALDDIYWPGAKIITWEEVMSDYHELQNAPYSIDGKFQWPTEEFGCYGVRESEYLKAKNDDQAIVKALARRRREAVIL